MQHEGSCSSLANSGDSEKKMFCSKELAVLNSIIVLSVSVVVSMEVKRLHYC